MISEQSLADAVKLARQDVKKQKETANLPKEKMKEASRKVGHTAIVYSSKYKEKLKKRNKRSHQEPVGYFDALML